MKNEFDIIFVHAPSVYDFRTKDDVLFAYLSNSDSVHISPIFEMPPIGMLSIAQHLDTKGFRVEFFNVALQMLQKSDFDLESFFKKIYSKYLAVDLHWLAHAHGAIEVLKLFKSLHPKSMTIIGGISSTYYHAELIQYPEVDYVVRGYDTLLPMEMLLHSNDSEKTLIKIPNLTWKKDDQIFVNALDYTPKNYSAVVDWNKILVQPQMDIANYNIIIPQAGCEYGCKYCGGSKYFFKNYMGINKVAHKSTEDLVNEFQSVIKANKPRHTITSINFWHEYPKLINSVKSKIANSNIQCMHYSLNRIPSSNSVFIDDSIKTVLELSPDSNNIRIAKASGRGKYTMEEMEKFIDDNLDKIYSFEVYFMIGLPMQSTDDVWKNVDYCEHLLKKYRGKKVIPFLCPLLPFLDPGSEIFDNPGKFGYKILHRSFEDHRKALLSMNWRDRLNFETKYMSKEELVNISYASIKELTLLKNKYAMLPNIVSEKIVSLIDCTVELLCEIDFYQNLPTGTEREIKGNKLKKKIFNYNQEQFKMVRSQQRPIDLGFSAAQWFDTTATFSSIMN